jgi:hypothetical protein
MLPETKVEAAAFTRHPERSRGIPRSYLQGLIAGFLDSTRNDQLPGEKYSGDGTVRF